MRVFVTGATGALGRHLVPGLVMAGHEVTATTRTPGKVAQLRAAGAEPVVVDGLDREAVIAAIEHGTPGIYNVVDDDPAPVAEWLPTWPWSRAGSRHCGCPPGSGGCSPESSSWPR
jgi:D-arabinose 1-dehydrogenase-like Zn-dependent alcohol dehydrogenase